MVIRKAKTQGFCFGQSLEDKGLVNAQSVDDVEAGTLFVRAHGLPVEVFEKANAKGLTIVDATCPMVTKIHVQAEKLRADGYKIVVVGDPNHPEVKGTLSHVPGAWCIQSPDDIDALPRASRVGVVVQSTWSGHGFTEIVRKLSSKYYEVRAVNTICTDTHNRQSEAEELAEQVEVMVVVGGKASANTKHLADLAATKGARSYHIEGPSELEPQWFEGVQVAGLMSGASTPGWLVDQVEARMEAISRRVS